MAKEPLWKRAGEAIGLLPKSPVVMPMSFVPIAEEFKAMPTGKRVGIPPTPGGRASVPGSSDYDHSAITGNLKALVGLAGAWYFPQIKVIRRLAQVNPDVGQALVSTAALANTGHKITFNPEVAEEQVTAMRDHLINKQRQWAAGIAGIDGLVTRMITQAMIGGAISNEWVVSNKLDTVESVIFVNPEDMRARLNERRTGYEWYQKVENLVQLANGSVEQLVKLNPATYRYFALGGDGEIPYGIPPYLKALRGVNTQDSFLANIDFITKQLGLLGFIKVMVGKPDMEDGESESDYMGRLNTYLDQAKQRIKGGFSDGAMVGFNEEHDIEFNSISRDFSGVSSLFELNELMIASGLNTDASLLGRSYSSSETQITVIFTKMLSELRAIQTLVRANLEFGYNLELQLAGFVGYKWLKVEFRQSTLQDELKYQQGQEIKMRVAERMRAWGLISQEKFADIMDLEGPHTDEPPVPIEVLLGGSDPSADAEADQKREKGKDASDRKVRDKNKPQGTTKK